MTAPEMITLLGETSRRIHEFAALGDEVHRRSYGAGKWNGAEILAHVADADVVFHYRFLRAAAEEGTPIVGFDENVWSAELRIDARPAHLSAGLIEAIHSSVAHQLKTLPATTLERASIHPQKGPQTPIKIAYTIGRHTLHHLGQLDAIREGRAWTPAEAIAYWA